MANKLPPLPVGIAPGSGYWNDWYEKLRTLVNGFAGGVPWSSVTTTPTTLAGYGITDGQSTSAKNNANGYAGLNSSSRVTKGVDTTDDLIVDTISKGLVLKSPNNHYWRASISNAGVVTWTDLGLTKP
jgi:hypothetical protein